MALDGHRAYFFTKNDPLLIRKLTYFSILNDSVEGARGNQFLMQAILRYINLLYKEIILTSTFEAIIQNGKVRLFSYQERIILSEKNMAGDHLRSFLQHIFRFQHNLSVRQINSATGWKLWGTLKWVKRHVCANQYRSYLPNC